VPTAHTTPAQQPVVGSIPAQSAIDAAPQMLEQLRSDMGSGGNLTATAQAAVPQPGQPSGAPPPQAPPTAPLPAATTPPPPAASASLALNVPATTLPAGSSFQVPVVLNGGSDAAMIGLKLQYDPARLQLINAAAGDLLGRDGQPTGISHQEVSPGNLIVSVSRPSGAHGITGTGVVAVLTFQAKTAGSSDLSITSASVVSGTQQQTPLPPAKATIVVQ
jgi:general secretion pathway protein D